MRWKRQQRQADRVESSQARVIFVTQVGLMLASGMSEADIIAHFPPKTITLQHVQEAAAIWAQLTPAEQNDAIALTSRLLGIDNSH